MMTDPTRDRHHPVEGHPAGVELCPCGKPASHVLLSEDDPDWACLVPNFDPATGRPLPPVGRHAPQLAAGDVDPEAALAAHAADLAPPAWADRGVYGHDLGREGAVVYQWTAPLPDVALNEVEAGPLEVQAVQHRLLTLQPDGTVLAEDQDASVHCDAGDLWLSPDDARALAAALVACADRMDGGTPPAGGTHQTRIPAAEGVPDAHALAAEGVSSADPVTISVVPGLRGPFAWWEEEQHLAIRQGGRVETAAALRAAADRLGGAA